MSRPRSQAQYNDEQGATYLFHFEKPFGHAKHYSGWAHEGNLWNRIRDDMAGRGANLMRHVKKAGISVKLAWIWPDTTKDYEDLLKHRGGASKYCPECGHQPKTGYAPPENLPLPLRAPEKLKCYELERLGTDLNGVPLEDLPEPVRAPDPVWPAWLPEPDLPDYEYEIGA
jgi:hypothetical protein